MQTHYLGREEVSAYLRDFADRLLAIPRKERPAVWMPIGPSGRELVKELVSVHPELETTAVAVPVEFDRDSVKMHAESAATKEIRGRRVLILDSSIHSGFTFQRVVEAAYGWGAKEVCSYALVVKRSSSFIPSFWGVSIGDYDRAYFLLPKVPNNHFHDEIGASSQVRERSGRPGNAIQRNPYFHVRRLSVGDIHSAPLRSGTASLDRVTWADRYYEMRSDPSRLTYVIEAQGRIRGYVTITLHDTDLHVEAVAVDRKSQGHGYGPALLRWAETFARQGDRKRIYLWAIDKHVGLYERHGYRPVGDERIVLDDGEYRLMVKPVLSHLD